MDIILSCVKPLNHTEIELKTRINYRTSQRFIAQALASNLISLNDRKYCTTNKGLDAYKTYVKLMEMIK